MPMPILYSFRRCPYAMRARMALRMSDIDWEHREVDLKNKPQSMLAASPKGTVPVLQKTDGTVLDESLDIMLWALESSQKAVIESPEQQEMLALIQENDTDFKGHLDRYKYPSRYEDVEDPLEHREKANLFLEKLENRLQKSAYLFGNDVRFADLAIFPFIRQFSRVEEEWFQNLPLPHTKKWLDTLVNSDLFLEIMAKQPFWEEEGCDASYSSCSIENQSCPI